MPKAVVLAVATLALWGVLPGTAGAIIDSSITTSLTISDKNPPFPDGTEYASVLVEVDNAANTARFTVTPNAANINIIVPGAYVSLSGIGGFHFNFSGLTLDNGAGNATVCTASLGVCGDFSGLALNWQVDKIPDGMGFMVGVHDGSNVQDPSLVFTITNAGINNATQFFVASMTGEHYQAHIRGLVTNTLNAKGNCCISSFRVEDSTPIPEPATLLLLGSGLAGLGVFGRKRLSRAPQN